MNGFEGFYFKCDGKCNSAAFIFGRRKNGKNKAGFIQILTESGSFYEEFDSGGVVFSKRPAKRRGAEKISKAARLLPDIRLGANRAGSGGIFLDIDRLGLRISGEVRFGPFSGIKYDAMGPFRFFPFMECRHTVISMYHGLSGQIEINGAKLDFDGGRGYIEGDKGRSFPKKYFWTQCNSFDGQGAPDSLFSSCAVIPYLGLKFTGTVSVIILNGREYRLATYLGAKVTAFSDKELIITQGRGRKYMRLEITALDKNDNAHKLKAPADGAMSRIIEESLNRNVRFKFIVGKDENARTLFNLEASRAAFEYSDLNSPLS
jgi:hypothetical protein